MFIHPKLYKRVFSDKFLMKWEKIYPFLRRDNTWVKMQYGSVKGQTFFQSQFF